jgi:LPS sulfotransferase NodH
MSQILSAVQLKAKEGVTYLRTWFKHSIPRTRFVIFAQARTGSTLLGDLLRSHSKIYCDGELFQDGKLLLPSRYLTGRAVKSDQPVYGCQLKICQFVLIQKIDTASFLSRLYREGWKIIYLRRTNLLRQAISELVARRRNQWADFSKNPLQNKKLKIDSQQLMGLLEWRETMTRREKQALAGTSYLPLVYEDHLLNPIQHQQTLNRVFDYLDVETIPVKTRFHKTTTGQISDFIENYSEIESLIAQTGYKRFLS